MWLPNSISRSSLAVLLVGAAASDVPLPSPDRAVAIRPDATVTVTIDAPIYQGKLGVDTGVVGAALADTLVALLRSEYGFARWSTASPADYHLDVRLVNPDASEDPKIQFRLEGPDGATPPAAVRFDWEPLDSVWFRSSWEPDSVLARWAELLRLLQTEVDVRLEEDVLAGLPLGVAPVLSPRFKAVVPVHLDSIHAAISPDPQFVVRATVFDTDPVPVEEPALLYLKGCSKGEALYVCEVRGLVMDEDSLWTAEEVAAELDQPGRTVELATVHLWRFYPVVVDPRAGGTIQPVGAP